jgi:site-specific recombinase XerD
MAQYKRVSDNLFIRVSTGNYYLIVKRKSRTIRKTLRTKIKSIAKARLFNELAKIGVSRVFEKKDVPFFANAYPQVVERAKIEKLQPSTVDMHKQHLKVASDTFGRMKVYEIDEVHLLNYLRKRSVDTSGHTANLDLQSFKRFFSLAIENGWTANDPTQGIQGFSHTKKPVHIPTNPDIQTVLKWLRLSQSKDRQKGANFVEFLHLSGVRIEGAQTIDSELIFFDKDFMRITEKGKKTREVPLFPQLKKFLLERFKDHKGLLFPGEGEKRLYYPKRVLRNAFIKTHIKPFTFHSLRHFFATECLEQGISPSVIAGWLGHKDNGILVMKTYANHIRRLHFAKEAQKVQIGLTH